MITKNKEIINSQFLTPKEVGVLLRTSTQTIQKFCKQGKIENLRIGRRFHIPTTAIFKKVEIKQSHENQEVHS